MSVLQRAQQHEIDVSRTDSLGFQRSPQSQNERVFMTCFSASASKALLRPEQKSMVWMKDIFHKFTLFGVLNADCCAGMISVAKVSTYLPHRRRFIEGDLFPNCVASLFPQSVLIFACQVLN